MQKRCENMNKWDNGSRQEQTASEVYYCQEHYQHCKGGTIYNPSKDILNFADREIGNVAIKITNITVDNTLKKELSQRPPFLAIPSKRGKLRTKTVNTTATVR